MCSIRSLPSGKTSVVKNGEAAFHLDSLETIRVSKQLRPQGFSLDVSFSDDISTIDVTLPYITGYEESAEGLKQFRNGNYFE